MFRVTSYISYTLTLPVPVLAVNNSSYLIMTTIFSYLLLCFETTQCVHFTMRFDTVWKGNANVMDVCKLIPIFNTN